MIVNSFSLLSAAPIKDMLKGKVSCNGVSHGLSELGYDIRIKQAIHFQPSLGMVRRWDTEASHTYSGRFIIASAMEEFDMPTDLGGIVHDKSTWARQGLSVFNTVIEPGWKGFLTLELVYHGTGNLVIPAGSGIAQVIFHQTACLAGYTGKYQNQPNEPVSAIPS